MGEQDFFATRAAERREAAEGIVLDLAQSPEPVDRLDGNCVTCGSFGAPTRKYNVLHYDTCPWKRARDFLAGEDVRKVTVAHGYAIIDGRRYVPEGDHHDGSSL